MCPSGAWHQERVFDILDEITSRYEVDGFFANWAGYNENDYFRVYHGVCHCESCQKQWDEYSVGIDLPDGPWNETYDNWKVWSNGVIDGGPTSSATLSPRNSLVRALAWERAPTSCSMRLTMPLMEKSDPTEHRSLPAVSIPTARRFLFSSIRSYSLTMPTVSTPRTHTTLQSTTSKLCLAAPTLPNFLFQLQN